MTDNGNTDSTTSAGRRRAIWTSIREAIHGTEQDFTTGSLNRAVFLLAIPMMLEMAGESLFAVVDAFFVARLGAEALAAVGITETVLEIIYAIAIGLGMSVTAMVARRIGEHDERAAARTAVQAIWVGFGVSILFGVAGAIWAPDVLRLMGADQATVALGATYTRIIYGSMPVILFLFVNNAIYRGAGDAAMAMRSIWIANSINIVLDPLFIFGVGPFPEMGLAGAAVATVIGRGIGVLYQFYGLSRGTRLRVTAADVRVEMDVILEAPPSIGRRCSADARRDSQLHWPDPDPGHVRKHRSRRLRDRDPGRDLHHPPLLGPGERRRDAGRPESRRRPAGPG